MLLLFDDDNNFDLDLDELLSGFFRLPVLLGNAVAMAGSAWVSFRLKLLSLRSLRADEKPLLELVRFDICAFDERSDFSLLNNFNLSSMDCLVGVDCPLTRPPFVIGGILLCTEYGLAGILQLTGL